MKSQLILYTVYIILLSLVLGCSIEDNINCSILKTTLEDEEVYKHLKIDDFSLNKLVILDSCSYFLECEFMIFSGDRVIIERDIEGIENYKFVLVIPEIVYTDSSIELHYMLFKKNQLRLGGVIRFDRRNIHRVLGHKRWIV